MDDILKVILSAEFDDNSWQNIVKKIKALRNALKNMKINIQEEGNFSANMQKLISNLEALNRKISEMSDQQVKDLKKVKEQAEKNAKEIKENLDKEARGVKDLTNEYENLLKTKVKTGKGAKTEVVTGNPNKTTTLTSDAEGNISKTVATNVAKARAEKEKMGELNQRLIRQEGELTSKQKEFQQLYSKLNHEADDYVDTSQRINKLYDELLERERKYQQLLERREQALKQIADMQKRGASERATGVLETATRNLDPDKIYRTPKGAERKDDVAERKYQEAIENVNKALQRSLELERNIQRVTEAKDTGRRRIDNLDERGFDVSAIKNMIDYQLRWEQSSEEVADKIKEINNEIKRLEQADRSVAKIEEQMRRLGMAVPNNLRVKVASGDEREVEAERQRIIAEINRLKQQGVQLDQRAIDALQRETQLLQQNVQLRQAELREQTRIRGDRADNVSNERVDEVFNRERYLDRQTGARDLAREYLEQQHGLRDLDQELMRVTTATDRFGRETMQVVTEVRNADGTLSRYQVAIDQTSRALYDMGTQTTRIRQVQSAMERFSESLRRVPTYLATFGVAYEVLNQVQQSFRILYEVDEAMTDLAKVTEITRSELEAFRIEASQMGQELGSTTQEVIKAVTEFQKLGYTFQQSKDLGETALVYANVGDMDIEDATTSLTSALKGFGVAQEDVVQQSGKYVDIFNEVANQYAVSSSGLGEALKRSSAQLHEAGNTVEQSVAMITAANAVIQDEKKVGTAMKTVSMRLRGVADEGENVTNLMPKLAGAFEDVGIKLTDANGDFKSTFEIMNELANVWNTGAVTEMERANLVELIAGKHHATTVSAMLGNWTDATNSYATALNSAGSASREFSRYQDSMVYRVDQLKATYQEFWLTFWDSEAVKNAITGITEILKILTTLIDKFGSFGFVLGIAVSGFLLFNTTLRTTFISGTAHALTFAGSLGAVRNAFSAIAGVATVATTAIKTFLKATIIGFAISAVVSGTITLLSNLITTHKEYQDTLRDTYEAELQAYQGLEALNKQVVGKEYSQLDRYSALEERAGGNPQQNLSTGELQEYLQLQEQIRSIGIEVIDHYDEEGNAVLKSAQALQELNAEKKEEVRLTRERLNEEMKKEATGQTGWRKVLFDYGNEDMNDTKVLDAIGLGSDVAKYRKAVEEGKKLKEEANKLKRDLEQVRIVQGVIDDSDLANVKRGSSEFRAEVDKIKAKLKELRDSGQISQNVYARSMGELTAFNPSAGGISSGIQGIIDGIEKDTRDLETELNDSGNKISDSYKELSEIIENDFQNFLDEDDVDLESNAGKIATELRDAYIKALDEGEFEDVEDAINNVGENLSTVLEKIELSGVDISALASHTPQATAELDKLASSMGLNAQQAELLRVYIQGLNSEMANGNTAVANTTGYLNQLQNERNTILTEYTQRAEMLAGAIQSVNSGEGLSISQITELIAIYPQLSNAITTQNGVMGFQIGVLQNLASQEEASMKTKLEANKAKIESDIAQVKTFIAGGKAQITAIKAVDSAYVKSAQSTARAVAVSMAQADMMAEKARLLKSGIDFEPGVWDDYVQRYARSYEARLKLQAESQLKGLESELAIINSLLNADIAGHVQKTTAPLKQPKAEKGTQDKQAKTTEELIYVTDKFKEAMRELNAQIREQQEIMEKYPTYSKEYQEALRSELGLIGQKIKRTEEEAKNIQKQIDQREIQKTGLIKKGEQTIGGGGGGGGVASRTLRVGSRGDDVRRLQKALGISADGIYGNQTANAVRNFQRSRGLAVDGIAGRQTLGALGLYGAGGGGATGGGGGGVSRNLKIGSRGEDVKALQRALGITADGIFGNQTANAVRNFQRSKGLSVDAIAGQKTLSALGLWGAGGGGVDAQNEQAKLQEAIDKAKDEKEQMLEDASQLRAEYNQRLNDLFGAVVSGVEHDSKKMENELAEIDFEAEKYLQDTDDWRENRTERLKILQQQEAGREQAIVLLQKELTSAENQLNEKLEEGLYDLIDEQKVGLINLQKEIFDLQREIQESVINEIVSNYEDEMEDYGRAIERIQNQQERFAENDLDKYAGANQEIIQNLETQIELTNQRLQQLKEEEERVKQFPELYEEWKDQVQELEDSQEDLNQQIYEAQKDTLDRQEEAIDELIELYQEYYESQMELELEALEKRQEAEEEASEKRIERWEKEADKYEEIVQQQLEALEEAENERQFERDLATRQQTRQDILDQIGLVSLDTSAEGKARLRQLQEELKNVSEEISESLRQKQLEERRKALEEQLEARGKENEKLVESEEERLEKEEEALEEHMEEIEQKWENLIENERKFAQMREDLLAGNISEMQSQIETFVRIITENSKEMGESISQNLIDNFINAKKELEELDNALTESQIGFNQEHGSTANEWYNQQITEEMIKNAQLPPPNVYWIYPTTPEMQNALNPASNITVNMTVGTVTGGQDGAEELMTAIANGLASRGVTLG